VTVSTPLIVAYLPSSQYVGYVEPTPVLPKESANDVVSSSEKLGSRYEPVRSGMLNPPKSAALGVL
jgi:hypothetical protein